MEDWENYYTTRQAAKLLNISLRTAQVWSEQGVLEAWKTQGGHRRISKKSVESVKAKREGRSTGGSVAAPSNDENRLRILVVEDDAFMLRLYRAQIGAWPFEVTLTTAKNAYEGLVALGSVHPHLLISDLRLPGLDGFEMLRAICSMDALADLTIAVVTGLDAQDIKERGGLPARVHQFAKPIPFDALEQIAQTVTAGLQEKPAAIGVDGGAI
jgi:excisionase family DNA binding protein